MPINLCEIRTTKLPNRHVLDENYTPFLRLPSHKEPSEITVSRQENPCNTTVLNVKKLYMCFEIVKCGEQKRRFRWRECRLMILSADARAEG
jgi:hypothetical protein